MRCELNKGYCLTNVYVQRDPPRTFVVVSDDDNECPRRRPIGEPAAAPTRVALVQGGSGDATTTI